MRTRPPKYTEELLLKAHKYIDDWEVTEEDPVPLLCSLAIHLDITRSTLYEWRNKEGYEEITDICEEVMGKQERLLVAGGLSNRFNSTITKLAMTKHNYSDRSEVKQETNMNMSVMSEEELQKIINGS